MNSSEFDLLLKSHSEERARELLAERYSLTGSQKPFLILEEGHGDDSKGIDTASTDKKTHVIPKQLSRRRKNVKKRASRHQERKSAASNQLQRVRATASSNISDYEPLNALWNEYIRSALSKTAGLPALQLILSADWNGARVRVESCLNPSLRHIQGILLWESRSQWMVLTPKTGLKLLPKRGTVIVIEHPDDEYLVVGDRVIYRPSERTTRKFKPHEVGDILAHGMF